MGVTGGIAREYYGKIQAKNALFSAVFSNRSVYAKKPENSLTMGFFSSQCIRRVIGIPKSG